MSKGTESKLGQIWVGISMCVFIAMCIWVIAETVKIYKDPHHGNPSIHDNYEENYKYKGFR